MTVVFLPWTRISRLGPPGPILPPVGLVCETRSHVGGSSGPAQFGAADLGRNLWLQRSAVPVGRLQHDLVGNALMKSSVAALALLLASSWLPSIAAAQGLLWTIPADGAWVRLEGDLEQEVARPENIAGALRQSWRKHVTLRSVGSENAEWNGQTVPCRWIEIESLVGVTRDGQVIAGPGGLRIVKVLIPEPAITGATRDDRRIPVEYLPIVRGYEKIGENDPAPITADVLQVFPTLVLVRHMADFETVGSETVTTASGDVPAEHLTGTVVTESTRERVTHEQDLWRSEQVPFGLARWRVRLQVDGKEAAEDRSQFKTVTETTITMDVQEVGTNAEAKIPLQ